MIQQSFKQRLWPIAAQLHKVFSGPFHILDEISIIETCKRLIAAFVGVPGFINFFAVKACPNIYIMEILARLGFGFDCSSIGELRKAEFVLRKVANSSMSVGERLSTARIMFTSNGTSDEAFLEALRIDRESMTVIINIDDDSMIDVVAELNGGKLPQTISLRYNPGTRRKDGSKAAKFGNPEGQKYGIPHEKFIETYRAALILGAKEIGIHTMIASNCLKVEYLQETVSMLLGISEEVYKKFGTTVPFINMGGGIGVPYRPEEKEFPIEIFGVSTREAFEEFEKKNGWTPDFNMECGRYITGPNGVLVTKVIRKSYKYETIVSVDVGTNANPRPKDYGPEDDGYHHIEVVSSLGHDFEIKGTEIVSVCDSLCENCGRFATNRELPTINIDDILIILVTGAHALAMGNNYGDILKPQELLFKADGSVVQIRRAQTIDDLDATLYDLNKNTYFAKKSDEDNSKKAKVGPKTTMTKPKNRKICGAQEVKGNAVH